jgi:hypothetical protein
VSEADGVRSTVLWIAGLVVAFFGGRQFTENLSLGWLTASVLAVVVWRIASRLTDIGHSPEAMLRRFLAWGRQCAFVGSKMSVSRKTTEEECAEWNEIVEIGVDLALGDRTWAFERRKITEQIALDFREKARQAAENSGGDMTLLEAMLARKSLVEPEHEKMTRIVSARGERLRREVDALEALLSRTTTGQIDPEFMRAALRPAPDLQPDPRE